MFKTGYAAKHVGLAMAIALAVLLGGCANKDIPESAPYAPSGMRPGVKLPTVGPATSAKLTFDKLTLDSPPKLLQDKHGLRFYQFAYTDKDGKVYKCQLPEAMAQGAYSSDEWVRTFNIYRLPEVIKQKKVARNTGRIEEVIDFPFISPKPVAVQQPAVSEAQPAAPKPISMPALPPLPSSPTTTSAPSPRMPMGPGSAPLPPRPPQ